MFHRSFLQSHKMTLVIFVLMVLFPLTSQGWEIAVGTEEGLAFLGVSGAMSMMSIKNKTDDSVNGPSVVALAVDSISKRIYFSVSSPSKGNAVVLGISPNSLDSDPVAIIHSDTGSDDVQGLAYDEIGKSLYWTDSDRHAILWANISEGNASRNGTILHQLGEMDDPFGIAVDGCRRLIFWTNSYHLSPTIERSDLDGNNKITIISKGIFKPLALVLDPSGSGRIFWTDDSEGIHYKIETSRLDGTERTIVIHGRHHQPYALAFAPEIGKNGFGHLYWSDWTHDAVWHISLENRYQSPKKIYRFKETTPMGLITAATFNQNYYNVSVENVICSKEESLIISTIKPETLKKPMNTMIKDETPRENVTNNIRSKVCPDYCINGEPIVPVGKTVCRCRPGFSGQRCEESVCHNYCVHGSCSVEKGLGDHWEPKCTCRTGYSGRRCEYDPCRGYCLNGGRCRIEDNGNPRCTCPGSGQLVLGDRCERRLGLLEKMCAMRCSQEGGKTANFIPLEAVSIEQDSNGPMCMCPSDPEKYLYFGHLPRGNLSAIEDTEKQFTSSDSPFVLVLGTICIFLLAVALFLAFKVFSLRRLPRIKKRIIVSKGAVPLASGCGSRGGSGNAGNQVLGEQQQCEITIENCCNMNICETPCFEPQLRSPGSSGVSNKSGKEEKKMLLANMDVPKSTCGPCPGVDELY